MVEGLRGPRGSAEAVATPRNRALLWAHLVSNQEAHRAKHPTGLSEVNALRVWAYLSVAVRARKGLPCGVSPSAPLAPPRLMHTFTKSARRVRLRPVRDARTTGRTP